MDTELLKKIILETGLNYKEIATLSGYSYNHFFGVISKRYPVTRKFELRVYSVLLGVTYSTIITNEINRKLIEKELEMAKKKV